jgi:predicted nucleic acid-binding protein
MSKIVADADGLIKLGKSGALAALLSVAEVLVAEAVYEESVVTGKREMYDDAFELERELREGGAKVIQAVENEQAERLLAGAPSLGPGERAALRVAYESGAAAILTDDRVFLGFLAGAGMRVVVPAAAIVMLAGRGALSVEGAMEALGRIEGSIRSEVYEAAMEDLAGMREERG